MGASMLWTLFLTENLGWNIFQNAKPGQPTTVQKRCSNSYNIARMTQGFHDLSRIRRSLTDLATVHKRNVIYQMRHILHKNRGMLLHPSHYKRGQSV